MTALDRSAELLVDELDAAIAAHLDWTRRVLRCAVLRTSPGDDVMAVDAHCRCRFGRWFTQQLDALAEVDATACARVQSVHQHMHDAVRALCSDLLANGRGSAADLERFEAAQASLAADLAGLKTLILSRAARVDALTGLPLRYGLEEEFKRARARAERCGQRLVVMLADIDYFKRVNDDHGHAAGDAALRHVAQTLRAALRQGEPIFRFGGEEFLLLLQAVDRSAAQAAAERILQSLRSAPGPVVGGAALALRVSAGLCEVAHDEAMDVAVARADRALYAAKREGRDRWVWDAGAEPV